MHYNIQISQPYGEIGLFSQESFIQGLRPARAIGIHMLCLFCFNVITCLWSRTWLFSGDNRIYVVLSHPSLLFTSSREVFSLFLLILCPGFCLANAPFPHFFSFWYMCLCMCTVFVCVLVHTEARGPHGASFLRHRSTSFFRNPPVSPSLVLRL